MEQGSPTAIVAPPMLLSHASTSTHHSDLSAKSSLVELFAELPSPMAHAKGNQVVMHSTSSTPRGMPSDGTPATKPPVASAGDIPAVASTKAPRRPPNEADFDEEEGASAIGRRARKRKR